MSKLVHWWNAYVQESKGGFSLWRRGCLADSASLDQSRRPAETPDDVTCLACLHDKDRRDADGFAYGWVRSYK